MDYVYDPGFIDELERNLQGWTEDISPENLPVLNGVNVELLFHHLPRLSVFKVQKLPERHTAVIALVKQWFLHPDLLSGCFSFDPL